MQKNIAIGHLAVAGTYAIFGFNIVFCRDIAVSSDLTPEVLLAMRCLVATILFWIVSLFLPREQVPPIDLLKMLGAALIGIVLPQLTFLNAVERTTPVDLSIVTTITPIITMFAAAVFLREPITWKKAIGVVISFIGILWVILQSNISGNGASETTPIGLLFCVLNCACFALYLGTCRPLISRYAATTFMRWVFLFSFLLSLPLSLPQLKTCQFATVTPAVWWEVAFLIFFATFVAYLLLPIGQARIRPTLVSMYGYLQPLIAVALSISAGTDRLTPAKIIAATLVFSGVAIVNKSKKREELPPQSQRHQADTNPYLRRRRHRLPDTVKRNAQH